MGSLYSVSEGFLCGQAIFGFVKLNYNFISGNLHYDLKKEVYRKLGTLMPQPSIYYMQDPVISTPKGLVKPKMSIFTRKQEPDIVEMALGKEKYIHQMENCGEGGDVTISTFKGKNATMFFGINAASGDYINDDIETISNKGSISQVIRIYTPDFFDKSKRYPNENVMHLDTFFMPIGNKILLANTAMLEQSAVKEGKKLTNAYDWAKMNFDRIIEVPDKEQQGIYGWGANILPIELNNIISAKHLAITNSLLKNAGFNVYELELSTLTSGFGAAHCMAAYLR